MSILSAQCDELRSMAESVGLAMPQAATLMMEAADTIWDLREKLTASPQCETCEAMLDCDECLRADESAKERKRLDYENAKLREELEAAKHDLSLFSGELVASKLENAKLRELCGDMMWTIRHAHGYFKNDTHEMLMTYVRGCDGKPTHVALSLTCDEEEYERRMRELGIEAES